MEIVYWILDKVVWALGAISIGQWVGVGLIMAVFPIGHYYHFKTRTARRNEAGVIVLPTKGYLGAIQSSLEEFFSQVLFLAMILSGCYLILRPLASQL